MKTITLIRWLFMAGAVLLALIGLMSCEKNDELSQAKKHLKESRRHWEKMKRAKGDSYVYCLTSNSWNGMVLNTVLRVEKGRVASRSCYTLERQKQDTVHVYTESAAGLGTHKVGSAPLTIDEQYAMCARDLLTVDAEQNDITFDVDGETGLLSSCGYTPKGCVDDCFVGITIAWIRWEK